MLQRMLEKLKPPLPSGRSIYLVNRNITQSRFCISAKWSAGHLAPGELRAASIATAQFSHFCDALNLPSTVICSASVQLV